MALRTLVPIAAGLVAAAVLYGSLAAVVAPIGALLFPPQISVGSALVAAALSAAVAAACSPRLATGLFGWLRHLPASGADHRRALTAGLVVAQAPVLALVALGGLMAASGRELTTLPRLIGLLPLAWGATLATLRCERRGARLAAGAGAVAAFLGSWGGLAVALPLLVVAERWAGALVAGHSRRRAVRRSAIGDFTARFAPPTWWMWTAIVWRSLRWRVLAGWLVVPSVLLPAWLFLHNNRLPPTKEALAVRVCGVVAAVVAMAVLADGLVKRRPPWPWIRSLPWSAGARVGYDGVVLAAVALPVVLAASAMSPSTALPMLGALPVLALRASTAVRDGVGRTVGASGPLLVEGLLVAGVVGLLPWAAAGLLAATPLSWRLALERERRQAVSRWHELHHLAAGDPLSWSGT